MMFAASALAATLAAASAPAAVHALPGDAARSLSMAFEFATARSPLGAGVLAAMTVHIGDQQGCYRIRFVPDAEPDKTTIVRLAKPGDAGAAGCPDDANAAEWVLPGPEAEGVARIVVAWSLDKLDGAPPITVLSSGAFSLSLNNGPDGIGVGIHPAAGGCAPSYAYDPADGKITKLASGC